MSFSPIVAMLTTSAPKTDNSVNDRTALHALGVLVPIQFHPVKVLPGRHPLGRAGDGMRLLRTRRFIAGEDNPRDIDKFSPPGELQVMEWEDEAQASITLLLDRSASMGTNLKAPLRNACVMQLVYSLWRAGDRVGVAFFDTKVREQIRAANMRTQMQQTIAALRSQRCADSADVTAALNEFVRLDRRRHSNLVFAISDFVTDGEEDFNPRTDWRAAMNELRQNLVPVIISFQLPLGIAGLIKLSEPGHSEGRMTWFNPARILRINRAEKNRVTGLVQKFRSAGMDCMIISQQRDIYPQLTQLARARRQRKN